MIQQRFCNRTLRPLLGAFLFTYGTLLSVNAVAENAEGSLDSLKATSDHREATQVIVELMQLSLIHI